MTSAVAGFLLGLAGSVHCLAMCGPLVMSLRRARDLRGAALYHAARIAVYAVLGLIGGLAGHALAGAGLGRLLSVAGGVLLLAMAAHRIGFAAPFRFDASANLSRPFLRASAAARRVMHDHPHAGLAAAGALNALLPCGMLYAALAASVATATMQGAIGFMTAFGLGTFPALAALPLLARIVPLARPRLRLAAPIGLSVVGGMLILRGLA